MSGRDTMRDALHEARERDCGELLGVLAPDEVPHKCDPSSFRQPGRSGVYYANDAEPGTIWRCTCGALRVAHYENEYGCAVEWREPTRKERRQIDSGRFQRFGGEGDHAG